MVFKRFVRFRDSQEDLENDERTSPPKKTRIEIYIEKAKEIIRCDRCMSASLIEDIWAILKSTVHRILTEDLETSRDLQMCACRKAE